LAKQAQVRAEKTREAGILKVTQKYTKEPKLLPVTSVAVDCIALNF